MDFESHDSRPEKPIALVALTRHGVDLALQLQAKMTGSVCYVPERHRFAIAMGAVGFQRMSTLLAEIWPKHRALVCIMAVGIVVRQLATLLRHKTVDPAVVVLDERGKFVISLLSGHTGGANRLAMEISRFTGGQAVITTASDVQNKPALDLIAREAGLEIENVEMLSHTARTLLEDETLWVYDPEGRLRPYLTGQPKVIWLPTEDLSTPSPSSSIPHSPSRIPHPDVSIPHSAFRIPHSVIPHSALPGIWVSEHLAPQQLQCLVLRPRNLVVGLGCNRGTPFEEVWGLLETVFEREKLSLLSVRNLTTVDMKSDEPAVLEMAKALDRPVHFFSPEEIENITVPNPSKVVARHIGVQSVCEATALLSAQSQSLIVTKQKTLNATLAVARVSFS